MNSTAITRTILLHQRIHAARASLERSRTHEERASALVEEADALLSFQAYAHDHHVFDVESLAARVAMGEVTVREAFDHCDPLDLYSNELLRQLSRLMGPSDWMDNVERPSPAELFPCVQSCYRRGDLAGCLSLLRHYAANLDDWFYGDCLWIRQLVGMWGRDALAPFCRDLRGVEAVFEQENHSSGTPRTCLRAAWALTQDDATQARCVREVLSEYDPLCSLDPQRIHADRDPRAAVVELLLSRGLSEQALDLFERIAEPPAEGIDQQQATGCVGLQRLLPSLSSALAAERYARVEAYVFDRWIAPAHPRQLSSWLAVLRSDARARTLALLEAASPRDIDTPLSRLPFSVRPAVLRAVLGQLREQGVAPALTALIEDRPGLEQAMLQAPLEEDFYRSGVTMSPEQRVFDLLVCAARAGELEAIEALREWRSPNEITRPPGWFRELPRDALRVMMPRIFATRDTANELNFRWLDMLRRGSADARRRWRPMVARTEYEPSLLDNRLRGDGVTEDERARDTQARCEQLASSDRWADGVGLVRSARGALWARKAVAALCDRWLDECERDPDALSQRAWDAAEQLLTVASPLQLQRASRLRVLRESERLTHGFVVGSAPRGARLLRGPLGAARGYDSCICGAVVQLVVHVGALAFRRRRARERSSRRGDPSVASVLCLGIRR